MHDGSAVTTVASQGRAPRVKLALTIGMSLIAVAVAFGQPIERWLGDPRSVSQALDAIIEQCHCVITYEDPRYDASQVDDVTLKVRRDGRSMPRVMVPKAYPFAFAFDSSLSPGGADVVSTVRALLDTANQSGNPSRFLLDTSDSVLHVVPEAGSVLSTMISMPVADASALQFMTLFVDALTEAGGLVVTVGALPTNHLVQSTIHVGASNERADRVLVRALQTTGRKVYWRLFYDFSLKTYVLNLALAHPDRCLPSGRCDSGDAHDAVSLRGRNLRSGPEGGASSGVSVPTAAAPDTPCAKCWIPLEGRGAGTPESRKK